MQAGQWMLGDQKTRPFMHETSKEKVGGRDPKTPYLRLIVGKVLRLNARKRRKYQKKRK